MQRDKSGSSKIQILLYQACLNPWKKDYAVPFHRIMPLNQIPIHISTFCIIFFNILLFKFLNKQSLNSTGIQQRKLQIFSLIFTFSAIKAKDLKKERRKNLVPAKAGLVVLAIQLIYGPFYGILYVAPIELGKLFFFENMTCFILNRVRCQDV